MKKIIILSIAILSVVACSSHDDNLPVIPKAQEVTFKKPIDLTIGEVKKILYYGTWELNYDIEQEMNNPKQCPLKNTLDFKKNRTFIERSYVNESGICREKSNVNNIWKYEGNSKLTLKFGDQKPLFFLLSSYKLLSYTGYEYSLKQIDEDGKVLKDGKSYDKN